MLLLQVIRVVARYLGRYGCAYLSKKVLAYFTLDGMGVGRSVRNPFELVTRMGDPEKWNELPAPAKGGSFHAKGNSMTKEHYNVLERKNQEKNVGVAECGAPFIF